MNGIRYLPAHYLVLRHPLTLLAEFPGIDLSVSLELSSYCKYHGRERRSDHTVTFIYRCQHYEYHIMNSCASQRAELTCQTNMKWLDTSVLGAQPALCISSTNSSAVLPPLLHSSSFHVGSTSSSLKLFKNIWLFKPDGTHMLNILSYVKFSWNSGEI